MEPAAMTRRLFVCGFGSVVVGLPRSGAAKPPSNPWNWTAPGPRRNSPSPYPWAPWKKSPSIVVMSAANDPRLPDVEQILE